MSGRNSVRAYLGLGGNIGDPVHSMAAALRFLDAAPEAQVAAVSSLYRTPPWGKTDQPDFVNAAAAVDTALAPHALLDLCLATERSLKRERGERWGPRTIDMDILVYGSRAVREEGLEIPHPRMLERAFVIVPLAEIAPNLVLDGSGAGARANAMDTSGITRIVVARDWWKRET